ncbi:glutamate 5-kinase [Lipingzhangella halophila]|uniref:Glutamate 5-kinase n=1 Tax=Lipingzhangella halophila TaxID=1783352 RepID=A0A7W7RMA9_9ACTN|nr:hypothetical protein [Lipingzhangella halophila]MBB4934581.1 glutamate 5-kinase [Lipingzhangella halophila]
MTLAQELAAATEHLKAVQENEAATEEQYNAAVGQVEKVLSRLYEELIMNEGMN